MKDKRTNVQNCYTNKTYKVSIFFAYFLPMSISKFGWSYLPILDRNILICRLKSLTILWAVCLSKKGNNVNNVFNGFVHRTAKNAILNSLYHQCRRYFWWFFVRKLNRFRQKSKCQICSVKMNKFNFYFKLNKSSRVFVHQIWINGPSKSVCQRR